MRLSGVLPHREAEDSARHLGGATVGHDLAGSHGEILPTLLERLNQSNIYFNV
jgi:hypothetical protein